MLINKAKKIDPEYQERMFNKMTDLYQSGEMQEILENVSQAQQRVEAGEVAATE